MIVENSKFQTPSKSQIQITKYTERFLSFGHWDFGIGICLEIGACDLEFTYAQ